jgi:alpha-beta hydrolase superfamily lysophospholipase
MPAQSQIVAPACKRFGRRRQVAAALVVALIFVPNGLAYFHARAMTTFSTSGSRSVPPERLSAGEKIAVVVTGVNLPRPANARSPADVELAYETRLIRGDDGIDLEAWHIPAINPRALVIMFHGYAASKASLLLEAQAFHELGCETLLVDFRGSGGSTGNETTLGVYEADDVRKAVEHSRLLAGTTPLILYGQSMGSAAVLRAIAVKGVDADGVIVECPYDRLLSTVANRFSAMGLPAFPFAHMLVFWGGLQHGMNGFAHNPVEYAASVRSPALLMHGSRDPRVSVAEVSSIFEKLAGEKQFVLFPQAGHESYSAVDAARWNEAVDDFLERVTVRSK